MRRTVSYQRHMTVYQYCTSSFFKVLLVGVLIMASSPETDTAKLLSSKRTHIGTTSSTTNKGHSKIFYASLIGKKFPFESWLNSYALKTLATINFEGIMINPFFSIFLLYWKYFRHDFQL